MSCDQAVEFCSIKHQFSNESLVPTITISLLEPKWSEKPLYMPTVRTASLYNSQKRLRLFHRLMRQGAYCRWKTQNTYEKSGISWPHMLFWIIHVQLRRSSALRGPERRVKIILSYSRLQLIYCTNIKSSSSVKPRRAHLAHSYSTLASPVTAVNPKNV